MLPRILGRSSKGFKVPPCHLFRLAQTHGSGRRRLAMRPAMGFWVPNPGAQKEAGDSDEGVLPHASGVKGAYI